MNKREFLDLLRYYLRSYPGHIVNDIIADYEEHFRIGLENGKSEAEIAQELGSPKDIAEEFYEHELPPKVHNYNTETGYSNSEGTASNFATERKMGEYYQTSQTKPSKSVWYILLIIIAIVVLGPPALGVGFGFVVSLIGIVISLFAVVLALVVSGVASMVSWIYPLNTVVRFFDYQLHPVTSVFLGVFLICLAILMAYLTVLFLNFCAKGIKNLYLSIRWSIAKRRGK